MTAAGPLVLVIEDEPQMRRFLRATLTAQGYRVLEAATAAEGLLRGTSHNPALVLLDLGLPDGDGLDVTRRLREWSQTPIIVISARGREADKVEVLDAGADDYLTKPFGSGELLARIRVAMRHAQRSEGMADVQALEFGQLRIDFVRREVTRDGKDVHLTPTEYRLFALLAQNAGKVLTHRQILQHVWGPSHAEQTHYVRVQMGELRKKLEADPTRPKLLVTEPGIGYRLRDRDA